MKPILLSLFTGSLLLSAAMAGETGPSTGAAETNQVQDRRNGSAAMDRECVTHRPHQFCIKPGHPGAFVGPDSGKDKRPKRLDGHTDLDLLTAADSIQFVGCYGIDLVDGVKEQAATLQKQSCKNQRDHLWLSPA